MKMPSGKLKFAVMGGIALAFVAIAELSGLRQNVFPSEERIQSELGSLKKAQAQLQKELELSAELKLRRELFVAGAKDYWLPRRDGKPETEIPKAVNHAAKLTGLKISSLGEIRQVKVSEGISVMELSVSANDSVETVTRFMAEMYRATPRMRWQRCQLRPETGKDAKGVSLSGSISFVCISDECLAGLIDSGKPRS